MLGVYEKDQRRLISFEKSLFKEILILGILVMTISIIPLCVTIKLILKVKMKDLDSLLALLLWEILSHCYKSQTRPDNITK